MILILRKGAKSVPVVAEDSGYGVAVDGSGNAYVCGTFQDTVDFGFGAVTSAGNNDIFLLKLVP